MAKKFLLSQHVTGFQMLLCAAHLAAALRQAPLEQGAESVSDADDDCECDACRGTGIKPAG